MLVSCTECVRVGSSVSGSGVRLLEFSGVSHAPNILNSSPNKRIINENPREYRKMIVQLEFITELLLHLAIKFDIKM